MPRLSPLIAITLSESAVSSGLEAAQRYLQVTEPGRTVEELAAESWQKTLTDDIWQALACLSERHQAVLVARYGLDGEAPQSLQQTGRQFGVCAQRI